MYAPGPMANSIVVPMHHSQVHSNRHHSHGGTLQLFIVTDVMCLATYVKEQADWEQHLPLVLFACQTSVHAFKNSNFSHLQLITPSRTIKLAHLYDFVETHHTETSHCHKEYYDQHSNLRKLNMGDFVWLSTHTAGKLDPRWEEDGLFKSTRTANL